MLSETDWATLKYKFTIMLQVFESIRPDRYPTGSGSTALRPRKYLVTASWLLPADETSDGALDCVLVVGGPPSLRVPTTTAAVAAATTHHLTAKQQQL
jgi:hypothetical protein